MDHQKTPYKILKILQDGQFHSGEELGATLSITRSAIWKAVKHLIEIGIPVASTTGRGYCIENGLELLNQASIESFIDPTILAATTLHILDQTPSTNDTLLNSHNAQPFEVALAEQQTAGRGRHQRHWISPYGHNIYCSIRWKSDKDPYELSGLSLATAIAIVRALIQFGVDPSIIGLKWPNDVLINHKKLAGTLIELKAESHSQTTAVIGIGINTFLSEKDAYTIDQPWTSLQHHLPSPIQRSKLAGMLINQSIHALQAFSAHGLSAFLEEWNTHDIYKDQAIKLTNGTTVLEGTYQGITPRGELVILDNANTPRHIISGEMSLRPC